MGEVQLEIPARPEYLTLARQVVAAAAALEPTFADERIVIRCNLADDRIEVEVQDVGAGFDPGQTAAAPEAQHPDRLAWEHGLGIPLMRVLADEAEIASDDTGTAVRLVVYTPAEQRRRADG